MSTNWTPRECQRSRVEFSIELRNPTLIFFHGTGDVDHLSIIAVGGGHPHLAQR